ncbi:MAG: 30S ribosomal protein S15 [Candidatus Bilamarchaeum sp.]|jgi:small subunit ribosomal protein S15
MARLHSKKKGKAGTKRAKEKSAPSWVSVNKSELEDQIIKMAREGTPASKIALYMRDQKGIPSLKPILGMGIVAFLKKSKAAPEYPEDLMSLIKKASRMRTHLNVGKKDLHNKVKLGHVESKIQRLAKYYLEKGMLPKGWKYSQESAALIAK